jgi:hypothetical protein
MRSTLGAVHLYVIRILELQYDTISYILRDYRLARDHPHSYLSLYAGARPSRGSYGGCPSCTLHTKEGTASHTPDSASDAGAPALVAFPMPAESPNQSAQATRDSGFSSAAADHGYCPRVPGLCRWHEVS